MMHRGLHNNQNCSISLHIGKLSLDAIRPANTIVQNAIFLTCELLFLLQIKVS